MSHTRPVAIRAAVNDGVARAVAIVGLAGFALIHLLDLPDTIGETPYIGALYLALIVSALVLCAALARTSATRVWAGAAALVTSVMASYILSRTTGLPQDSGDVGNWGQSSGIAMLFLGGSLLALASSVLVSRMRTRALAGTALLDLGARRGLSVAA